MRAIVDRTSPNDWWSNLSGGSRRIAHRVVAINVDKHTLDGVIYEFACGDETTWGNRDYWTPMHPTDKLCDGCKE